MARNTPTPGQKITYFVFIVLGISILYIDINSKIFSSVKNNFQSFKISSSFVIKNITVNPLKEFVELMSSKQKLLDENTMLRKKLEDSYLRNFLITKENTFYTDRTKLVKSIKDDLVTESFNFAKLTHIDPNIFNCCDRHRMYIEILDKKNESFKEAMVFNLNGIIGQIVANGSQNEVILLTDVKSSIPIKNSRGDFFCNAMGSGKANLISCSYSQLVWINEHKIGDSFYSSGLGGIYPKDIKLGELTSIDIIDSSVTKLEIELVASPLDTNFFGVIKI